MQRKTRNLVANSVIAAVALTGGVLITNQQTERAGGLGAVFGLTGNNSSGPTASKDGKATGDSIAYEYGTVQLEVVRSGGKLTEINLLQAGANAGREQAFPYLVQYALDAQGTGFANLSGATFTTDAFKQALDSAVSKLG